MAYIHLAPQGCASSLIQLNQSSWSWCELPTVLSASVLFHCLRTPLSFALCPPGAVRMAHWCRLCCRVSHWQPCEFQSGLQLSQAFSPISIVISLSLIASYSLLTLTFLRGCWVYYLFFFLFLMSLLVCLLTTSLGWPIFNLSPTFSISSTQNIKLTSRWLLKNILEVVNCEAHQFT